MTNIKVSVIVPIYNVEMHLEKCIHSIINQTYRNIEIILVNDGSTDSSPHICDKFQEGDARIKVVHKDNGGMSDARNTGMLHATGDYYMFIDSDDWIESEMTEDLLDHAINHQAEIVMCTISSENGFRNDIQLFPWDQDRYFNRESIINEFLPHFISMIDSTGKIIKTISGSVCRCLYSSKLLVSNNIFFDINVGSGQDKEFNLRVLNKCNSIYTTNMCYYHYNRSINFGGSTTQRYSPGLYAKVKYRQECYVNTLKEGALYDEFEEALDFIWLSTISAVIKNFCYEGNPASNFEIVLESKKILKDSGFIEKLDIFTKDQLKVIGYGELNLLKHSVRSFIYFTKFKLNLKRISFKLIGKL